MTTDKNQDAKSDFIAPVVAGALAWLIPGAGHFYLRRPVRGIVLFVIINALFWSGVAIGGAFTVEPTQERWWYMAQMCTGVPGLAAKRLQGQGAQAVLEKMREQDEGANISAYQQALSATDLALTYPGDVIARAYSGIAGMLNLMCIFDAIMLAMMGRTGEPPKLPRRDSLEQESRRQ